MLKKDYSIFPKKVDVRKVQRDDFDPLKPITGLVGKYARRLEPKDILKIIGMLVVSMDETNMEDKDYQREVEGLMQHLNKDEAVKKKLKEMRDKRNEINEYTHQLIEMHKKNKVVAT